MIFVIDNYDSFTYNLVQYLGELGEEVEVARNDKIAVADIATSAPQALIVSPGPCTPAEAGISVDAICELSESLPTLGVCLGHQAIVVAMGGEIETAPPMHGKVSPVFHEGEGLFAGLPNPLTATRYHSLVARVSSLPESLRPTAWTHNDGEPEHLMALEHRSQPLWGVQFHPESILTEGGRKMLANFLRLAEEWRAQ